MLYYHITQGPRFKQAKSFIAEAMISSNAGATPEVFTLDAFIEPRQRALRSVEMQDL